MQLRKCPSCRDIVGADSVVCPRCGVDFRLAVIRKTVWRILSVGLLIWLFAHFVLHKL